jgi:hypothetical protein
MSRATIAIMALCLAASGCKQSAKETGGQAAGTILPGSTSDAMIPLDQVRSEPPLAPAGSGEEATKKTGAKGAASGSASDGDIPAPSATPAAAPSAAPTPETAET